MSKTIKFDIHSDSPQGTTFQGNRTHAPDVAASWSQKKPKINTSIHCNSPQGTTFVGNKPILNFPKASDTPMKSKQQTTATGTYSPSSAAGKSSGTEQFPGGNSVGGTMKKGAHGSGSKMFRK